MLYCGYITRLYKEVKFTNWTWPYKNKTGLSSVRVQGPTQEDVLFYSFKGERNNTFLFLKITQKFIFSFLAKQMRLSLAEYCYNTNRYSYEIKEVTVSGSCWVIPLTLWPLSTALFVETSCGNDRTGTY